MRVRIKEFTIFSLIIVFTAVLVGCGASETQGNPAKAPSAYNIGAQIKASIDLSEMEELSGSQKLQRLYDISSEDIEEYWIMTPSSNIKAREIVIIKAKDSDKVDDIVGKLEARIDRQANSFKDYIPEEYFLIQDSVLKSRDNFVLLVISEDPEAVEKIFDGFF